ncbi:uncharacterized protein SAMN05892883_1330 [Jatrophihabitans sp. GAS493]|uniref:DUF58 domain-containing protein n=1 Tax=Jatrophihabitans sp. GAS493 TaxID=1907575 RepID=UPI000BB77987|nr:DUF58 domain-containing protein [Jatrophihabitans sp. GAS493]SOD71869.1 uncharacterized protein SAMN05892883_1330 [Jatrophihabitans sp. GAS493]
MTRTGIIALIAALGMLTTGLWLNWVAFSAIGISLFLLLILGGISVARPSQLTIDRQIQPPRVPKGSPAIAFLTFANRGRSSVGVTVARQPFGSINVRTVIPRLRRGERGMRTYRLPTTHRGIFDVGPVEVNRADPFELFRVSRRYAEVERIWVYPRLLPFRPLPSGQIRHLEGPSSDTAPQGNITFHRLRDYNVGDDLRLVHWRSSARTGRLVVKHNVDTSQPYSVVLLDQSSSVYTPATFESAVDVCASVLTAVSSNKAPAELRSTDGTILGGPRLRDVTSLIDYLTGIKASDAAPLEAQLLALRRAHGGTSLVVVTGVLDPADLPAVAALRRRFERLVVISITSQQKTPISFAGVRVIVAEDADEACALWNVQGR